MPTLCFIAEMQKVYRDVYGATEEVVEEEIVEAKPKAVAKPKTKKDVLFSKPKVTLPVGATWTDITIANMTPITAIAFAGSLYLGKK